MTTAAEIVDRTRLAAAEVVLGIAGACMTDDMLDLFCDVCAGKSRSEIRAMFTARLPAEKDRTGILMPYLTAGTLRDYPARLHDLVAALVGVMMSVKTDVETDGIAHQIGGTVKWAYTVRPGQQVAGTSQIKAIGSRGMTLAETPPPGPSGVWFRNLVEPYPPSAVWAIAGLTPRQLGIGFAGSEELKGAIPAGTYGLVGGQVRVSRDVPLPGNLSDVSAQADQLFESGKMP